MSIIASSHLEGLERCPHCSIAKPSLPYKTHVAYPHPTSMTNAHWIVYQCTSCSGVVCALITASISGMQSGPQLELHSNRRIAAKVIPSPKTVASELPDRPRRYIEQAIASLHAPDGALMLAGSAVDAMLKLKGYEEGSVHARIGQAVKDGVLTTEMSEWAHAVRLGANKPRHADIDEPHATKELAEQAIQFVEALGEYLFVLPARIERGRTAAVEATKTGNTGSETG
ncbi:MAG: DUF4145 domain-containing protein [Sphingorhabdus sp.]|uniref:DUF4145 domain-containing protein n=1 Tax=Sphingorhabdus sp. TaxID=1902408 RepID=UPI003CB693FF